MSTTVYLVRHGETRDADPKRYKGSIDVPLSRKGIEQMKRLAQFMVKHRSHSLNAVYTSGLMRAHKSAEIVSRPFGLQPVVVPELRERSFGKWEGMTFDEIRERYPAEFEAWAGNPLKFSPTDGESTLEVKERSLNALNGILKGHSSETHASGHTGIAIVSHGGIIRIILCHVLGIPLENIFRIEQDFAALNIIEFHDNAPVVRLFNGTV